MSNLEVKNVNGQLVVDSRLIAAELGVNHGAWMTNIVYKYQTQTEQAFGVFHFQNGVPDKPGNPPRFVWLTEDQ